MWTFIIVSKSIVQVVHRMLDLCFFWKGQLLIKTFSSSLERLQRLLHIVPFWNSIKCKISVVTISLSLSWMKGTVGYQHSLRVVSLIWALVLSGSDFSSLSKRSVHVREEWLSTSELFLYPIFVSFWKYFVHSRKENVSRIKDKRRTYMLLNISIIWNKFMRFRLT